MDWLSTNRSVLQGPFTSLGWLENNIYISSPDCAELLTFMERELAFEDLISRNVRRNYGLSRVVQQDLVPILIHVNDQEIIFLATRILVNLTMPVECLLPFQLLLQNQSGQETVRQMQLYLLNAKKAFLDNRATTALVSSIRNMLHQNPADKCLSEEFCIHVNNVLLLLRNILHMPDAMSTSNSGSAAGNFIDWQSVQNKLIWNLFAQGLDVALLLMLNSKNKTFWTITMVQLIALLYKDQHIAKIQKLLSVASESSGSSEDDFESDNTSKKSASGICSSYDSSKDLAIESKTGSDSGYPPQSEEWSSCPGSSLSRSCSPYRTPLLSETSSSSNNSSFDSGLSRNMSGPRTRHHSGSVTRKITNSSSLHKNNRSKMSSDAQAKKKANFGEETFTSDQTEDRFNDNNCRNTLTPNDSLDSKDDMITSDLEESENPTSSDEELKKVFHAEQVSVDSRSEVSKQKQKQWPVNHSSETDSSNEDEDTKLKPRSHPPVGWKCKSLSDVAYQRCSSSVCLDAALESAHRKGRIVTTKEAILEKRRKVCMLADNLAHTPSNDDISNVLKDFTLAFLHCGFSELVVDVKNICVAGNPIVLDKSHFIWLLTYFLRLSSSHSLSYHHFSNILSSDIISYLTFEGIMMIEELDQISFHPQQVNIQPLLRRMHLLVTAFSELFNTIDNYCKKPVGKKERSSFKKLRVQIADMVDVRQLFFLLIRKYDPLIQSKQYLVDVISTNHLLLLLLEKVFMDPDACGRMDLPAHISQFGTVKIMEQYGNVLEDFKENSEFVNDCVFTMMHHVVGGGSAIHTLFHPLILKTFCKIAKEDFQISEIWEDLINYVLSEFSRVAQKTSQTSVQQLFGLMTVNSENGDACVSSGSDSSFGGSDQGSNSMLSSEDLKHRNDSLYWWYLQYEHHSDPVGKIQEGLLDNHVSCSRQQILQDLLSQGIISKLELDRLKSNEAIVLDDNEESNDCKGMIQLLQPQMEMDSTVQLVRDLILDGHKKHVEWLQRSLLEACYVKSELRENDTEPIEDPVPFYSHCMKQSIPLVLYDETQETIMRSEKFMELLHNLGFHLPADVGKIYPRIPSFWTADVIYSVAKRLGPTSQQKGLKFSLCKLEECLDKLTCSSNDNMNEDAFNMMLLDSPLTSDKFPAISRLRRVSYPGAPAFFLSQKSAAKSNRYSPLAPRASLPNSSTIFDFSELIRIFASPDDKIKNSI